MIFAFDHPHTPGQVCSRASCEHARRAPVLAGSEVYEDIPMLILRHATAKEYIDQAIPADWCLPPIASGYIHFYEVSTD